MIPEFRTDLDQHRMNADQPHVLRHHGSDPDRKVDVVDTRHVGLRQHGLPDAGTLLSVELNGSADLVLLAHLALLLALLRLLALLVLLTLLRLLSLLLTGLVGL